MSHSEWSRTNLLRSVSLAPTFASSAPRPAVRHLSFRDAINACPSAYLPLRERVFKRILRRLFGIPPAEREDLALEIVGSAVTRALSLETPLAVDLTSVAQAVATLYPWLRHIAVWELGTQLKRRSRANYALLNPGRFCCGERQDCLGDCPNWRGPRPTLAAIDPRRVTEIVRALIGELRLFARNKPNNKRVVRAILEHARTSDSYDAIAKRRGYDNPRSFATRCSQVTALIRHRLDEAFFQATNEV